MADAEPRSPLKRLPSLANSSKFVTCWTSILSGSDPTIPSTPVDQDNPGASGQTSAQSDSGKGKGREVDFEDARERWYQDLFCLRVNAKALEEMIVVKNEDDLAQEGLKVSLSVSGPQHALALVGFIKNRAGILPLEEHIGCLHYRCEDTSS